MCRKCKIHVIFTGGTIGSKNNEGIISTASEPPYELISSCTDNSVSFTTSEPYRILSENLTAEHLLTLAREVNSIYDTDVANIPDGIIIAHGSDTIQYTSAFLANVFYNIKIPIVLIASAYVLSHKKTNGFDNFACAVSFIKNAASTENELKTPCPTTNGVFVCYRNMDEATARIHPGSSMQKPLAFSPNLYSYTGHNQGAFAPSGLKLPDINALKLTPDSSGLLWLVAHPGIVYPAISAGTKAIMIESYHSGTLCIDSKLKAFAGDANKYQIPIFVAGLSGIEDEYDTVSEYKKIGIIPINGMTPINLYIILWLMLSNGINPLECL